MGVGANSWELIWVLVSYSFYKSCMHSHVICIYTRVAAAAEEVVYEVVVEPQEPQGQAPPQEVREESAHGPTHPSVEQQTQDKPRCTSFISNYDTYDYVSITCALGLGNCWEP